MTTITVDLPPKFYDDHTDRDLAGGIEIRRTKTYVRVVLTYDEWAEIYSDASYYSEARFFDSGYAGLCASARATLRKLQANRMVDPNAPAPGTPATIVGLNG